MKKSMTATMTESDQNALAELLRKYGTIGVGEQTVVWVQERLGVDEKEARYLAFAGITKEK